MSAARIAVIGGGVGGLAAAALLARGGATVTLFERHDSVGGRANRLELEGFTWDTGPSWYLMREAFDHFYSLVGRSTETELDLVELDPRYRVYFEGRDSSGPGDRLDISANPEANYALFNTLSPGDGDSMRSYAAEAYTLYRLALDRFLYTTFERPNRVISGQVLRSLPQLAGLLTRSLRAKVAGRVRDERLRKILGFHAVFLGSSPSRTPSLFSLMSHLDLTEGVRYPRGGMYEVIRSLERIAVEEGVEIRTGAPVRRVLVSERGIAQGVELEGGEVVPADAVVSGADMHHTETELIPAEHRWQPEGKWARRSPGVSALLVFAGVRGSLPELAHHTLFFTRDWESNFADIVGDGELRVPVPASLYVSRVTATDPSAAPAGMENLFMLVPFPADPSLGSSGRSRAELEQRALAYLEQVGAWAGIPDLRERTTIFRITTPADFAESLNVWRGSALGLEHTVRQSALFRPGNVSNRVPNLMYVGSSTLPGIGMPICLISAELVAKRMLGLTDVSPLPTPVPHGFLERSVRKGILGDIARGTVAPASAKAYESTP